MSFEPINKDLLDNEFFNADAVGTGIETGGQIISGAMTMLGQSIANKSDLQRDVQAVCGRKPVVFLGIGKAKQKRWMDCSDKVNKNNITENRQNISNQQVLLNKQTAQKNIEAADKNKKYIIIGSIALGIGLLVTIGFISAKRIKAKAEIATGMAL